MGVYEDQFLRPGHEVIRLKNRGTLHKTLTEQQMVVNTVKQSPKE
jgi:hypothetical protein